MPPEGLEPPTTGLKVRDDAVSPRRLIGHTNGIRISFECAYTSTVGLQESNPACQRRLVPAWSPETKRATEVSLGGSFPGLCFRRYGKGALRPGFSTRSWAGTWLANEHMPVPKHSACEPADHALFWALAGWIARAVSFINRIIFLA